MTCHFLSVRSLSHKKEKTVNFLKLTIKFLGQKYSYTKTKITFTNKDHQNQNLERMRVWFWDSHLDVSYLGQR